MAFAQCINVKYQHPHRLKRTTFKICCYRPPKSRLSKESPDWLLTQKTARLLFRLQPGSASLCYPLMQTEYWFKAPHSLTHTQTQARANDISPEQSVNAFHICLRKDPSQRKHLSKKGLMLHRTAWRDNTAFSKEELLEHILYVCIEGNAININLSADYCKKANHLWGLKTAKLAPPTASAQFLN